MSVAGELNVQNLPAQGGTLARGRTVKSKLNLFIINQITYLGTNVSESLINIVKANNGYRADTIVFLV